MPETPSQKAAKARQRVREDARGTPRGNRGKTQPVKNPARTSEESEAGRIVRRNRQDKTP